MAASVATARAASTASAGHRRKIMMPTESPVAQSPAEPEPQRRAAGFEHANEAKSESLRGLQLRTQ
jgi:hypothetical protein